MVDATRSLGVRAQRVDAASLLFADASCHVVVAAWMLYHVGDLHATLGEVRRVLQARGHLRRDHQR
jgi:ubiquinone/menaquinone biosynthesis C-methylase UbiE